MAERESDAPRLVVTGPAEFHGVVFPLTRHDTVIGHSESADLVLDDRFVSRLHALISIGESGIAVIHDLHSRAGTLVNGEPVTEPRRLQQGDIVSFADLTAKFETAGSAPASAADSEPATQPLPPPRIAAAAPAAAGKIVMPGPPASRPATGPALTELASVLGPDAAPLITTLVAHGIATLAQVRQAGSLARLTTPGQAATVTRLKEHADLARLSSNVAVNAAIIAAGYTSTLAIARAPQATFITAAAPTLGEPGAITMHAQAVAMYNALDDVLTGARLDSATAAGTRYSATVNAAVDPDALQSCCCDDCQSAVSPTAYLADLLNYATTHLLAYGQQIGLPYLTETFYQPFGDLPTDCAAVEALVRQARICCEALRGYLGANPPAASQANALVLAEKLYVLTAYEALLTGLGTSFDEVRLATVADPAARSALADRLGLTIDPYGAGRPDVVDRLVLGPPTAVPPPPPAPPAPPAQQLTEANIERLSGLAATTRNPLSDGPVIGDPNGIIGRWNLDGVSWGRNTDADGTVYLWLAQPGVGELDVALYKDKGLTELVAFGQLSPPGTELPASITVAPENNSGLSGALEVTQATETEAISFGAIPLLTSWQLATLRAEWQTEDQPADPYMAGTSTVPLAQLPAGVTIPAAVPAVSYNSAAQVLTSTAVLAPAHLTELLQAAQGNAAAASYVDAVNALYVASQRQPVIDPDVLGPDDFRVPSSGAAAGNQPFGLWVTRRQWVDTQLGALQTAQGSGIAPSFTGMLGWMQNDLTYGPVTAKPWAPTTPVDGLEALWENLAQGVDVPAITTQLASDLCLQPQEFNALMDLWHADQAASAEPPGPPLSSADWRDAVSLLTQAAKTRFFAAWRAEENGLPLDFGSDTFIVCLREPQPGDWPPVPTPGAPLIDPATVPLTGLPEPTTGGQALQLWTARQAIEATLTSKIRSANESGGFQAMLQQALGDPNAGDPLPADLDTLAQQLTSTDPSVVAAATTAITTKLFMTVGQYHTLMKLRTMDADPNPDGKPTPAQWAALYAILTTAETAKREYPQWVLAEHSSGVTYWMALKARLPMWRASADQRSQWHAALAQRIRLPVIDPDVISPADMINPVTGDPAFDLWNVRTTTVAGLITIPGTFPATTASLDALLVPAIGLKSQDLTDLATQAAQGADITARLAQLTLTYAALTQLTTVIGLVAGGIVPLEPDQSACYAILADAQKQRLYAQWNQAETAAGIIAGPDEFAPPAAGATLPQQPPWLAPAGARQAWETTLQSRIEQQATTQSANVANADAAEGATITSLRDALARATDAPGATLQAQGDWLTGHLLIDAETGGSVKTTRIEQAIETLQGLMAAVQSGLGGLELTLSSAPAVTSALGGGRYDVFAVGPGQALWHKYWDGSWHDWENLGGILTSAPAVISQVPGGLDVFARGADNALWHLAYGDGAWGSWASLGGLLHQGPAAGTPEIDSVDVFVVGPDNQLWQLSESDGTWGSWQQAARTTPLPANGIISAPSVTGSNGSYDVFAEGADSALWHASYDGAAWSGWTSLGGSLSSAPSATGSNGPLQVFARFTDDTIRSLTAQPNGSWQGSQWTSLGGYATQGPGALAENNVFTVGVNGFLYHKWLDSSGWHGWDTTTPISLDAPDFDDEWTWMGSYATWRAAMMCRAYPENILDPALRPLQAQTPGFTALVQSVQGTASLTAAQASQFAAAYDRYFRDICSLEVTLSCFAPPVPPGSPQYLFGIAANSRTVYWSSYDPAGPAGYQQSFWNTVPGLAGQQLSSLAATTSLIVTGTMWVLLVVVQDTTDGPVLEVLRYNTTIDPATGTGSWDPDGPYTLTLQPGWTPVTAGLGYQGNPQHQLQLGENTALYPPYLVVTVDGSQYERQLSADGTQWAAGSEFVLVGQWAPWTQAAQAQVASGQQIAAVSPAAGQIDLFWVDYSESGGTNTVTTATANLSANGGALGNAAPVDNTFNTWALTSIPVGQRGNYQTPLTVAARGANHLDIIALGFSGVNWGNGFTPDGHHGRNDVYWSWQDADVDGGQWQPFQRISSGSPGDGYLGYPLLNNGHYVIDQVAAVGSGDTLSVLVLTDDGGLYVNWNEGMPEPGGWQETWANVAAPSGLGRTVIFQVLTALCSDPAYIDVQATDSTGVVWGWRWPAGTQPPAVNFVGWFTVNYGGQASAGTCGAVVAEAADIYDFCYLGEVPASVTLAPLLVSRIDQTGAVRQRATTSLGGGLFYADPDPGQELPYSAPVAALQRGQSRVEVYVAGPGSAIWTRWTDDPATPGSWSPWAAISNDGGDISTLAPRWSVSAVSQQPLRTDLFAALYGGATGSQGGIYTTYWQDVDFQAAPLDLPPFAVPAGSPPLNIPAQESSTDLQQRAQDIRSAFAANQGAPASTLAYLQEAYYFVPVYLANQLVQQGQYQAALDWYRTVYDNTVPEQIRDIYYGLVLDENLPAAALTLPAGWLLDPLNPHAIAATRRDAYTRYTVLQIVQCLFAWADSLFTTDTSESDAQARALYLTGLALLGLDIFGQQAPCDDLLIEVSEIPVDPDWQPLLAALGGDLATIRSRPVLAGLVPQLTGALTAKGAWPAKFATARGLIATARRDQSAQPRIGGVLSSGASLAAAAYSALLSVPAIDAAATAVSAGTAADPRLAARTDLPHAAPRNVPTTTPAGMDRSHKISIAEPVIPHQAPPPEPPAWIHIPAADFWFCLPANPVVSALLAHGEICLHELRNGLNIAGQPRQLAPYSAPTNAGSGLPAISAGGQLQTATAVTYLPTAYPYATLIANAKQLVQTAQGIEGQMLAALQQRDQDLYEQLQASQNLAVATATVQLQTLAVQQVTASVTLAQLQQQTAQLQAGYWQQLLGSDIGSLEQSAISAMTVGRDLQEAAAANSFVASVVSAFNPSNWASFGATTASDVSAGLSSAAAAASSQAGIYNAQASLELQQDTWQYQYQAATAGAQTAGQQITISTDQLRVAGQQLVINQLQASNATDTVNFLANKFTSAPLYDWMAGVLQGVYSFYLQQATVIARQAENQLAFQRQRPPAGYIRSSYWQPASANLLAAGTPDNTMGLTGAEQLGADITKLDQYAISIDQRQLQLTATLSLAQLYPLDFQVLRETGVMNFGTTLAQFDQNYPGHYLRLIQQVSTSVIALIPPGRNINATLSSTGVSQVVIGPEPFQEVIVRTDPQSVAITTPVSATGVLGQDPQAGLLLPFQYLGVATQWRFELPLAGNQFDFSTLADVQITISYTAMSDPGYRAQVIKSLHGQVSQERPYSFVNDLPDQWYDLNNPDQTPSPMRVQFDVAATDFPANLNNIEIQQVVLYFAIAAGQTFEVSVSSLQFFESGSPAAVGGAATTVGGTISTRRGNAPAWIPMIGQSPFGTWQLTLPDTAQVRGWFTGGLITDILFDITYTAETPPWPT